jgi:hypothetical protein
MMMKVDANVAERVIGVRRRADLSVLACPRQVLTAW